MNTTLLRIPLTKVQQSSADWLLDAPLFYADAASVEWDWAVTPERATELVALAAQVRLDGSDLVVPADADIVDYLISHVETLVRGSDTDYFDRLIDAGHTHQQARLKANAAVRSAESLLNKLSDQLAILAA
jgi:hypothetical protein